jgi:hypothetical protein
MYFILLFVVEYFIRFYTVYIISVTVFLSLNSLTKAMGTKFSRIISVIIRLLSLSLKNLIIFVDF